MDQLAEDINKSAQMAIKAAETMGWGKLDYSEESLNLIEEMADEAAQSKTQLSEDQISAIVQQFGSYIHEVARRHFGGKYYWYTAKDQPILVVGEPDFRISMITWDKIRGRISGDLGDNIPFFYAGFAERVKSARPGEEVFFV